MIGFVAFTVSLLLTAALVRAAPNLGWLDRREGLEHRKPRTEDVPVVGGAAILGVMGLLDLLDPSLLLPWPALIGAFLLGLVDDVRRGGLGPAAKLSGQILVATLLVVAPGPGFDDYTATELLAMAGMALVAMNVVNLFDHADGVAGAACCVALGPGAPALAAAVGGYLPFNTFFRRRKTFRESVPMTMLGDSGTHLLGVAVAVTPGAAWLLLVPLLDAMRVVVGRWSRGKHFWEGDRTHLGNRLVAIGVGPLNSALVVVLLVAPSIALPALFADVLPPWAGFAVSAVFYVIAVWLTHGVSGPAATQPAAAGVPVDRDEPDGPQKGAASPAPSSSGSLAGETPGSEESADDSAEEPAEEPAEESAEESPEGAPTAEPMWSVVRQQRDELVPAAPPEGTRRSAPLEDATLTPATLPDGEPSEIPGGEAGSPDLDEPPADESGRLGRRSHPLTGSL